MKGAQFKYVIEKPIYNLKKDYNHNDELNLLLEKINKIIGKWILKNPSQWLGYIIDGNMIIFEILLNIVGLAFYRLILHPSVNEGQ